MREVNYLKHFGPVNPVWWSNKQTCEHKAPINFFLLFSKCKNLSDFFLLFSGFLFHFKIRTFILTLLQKSRNSRMLLPQLIGVIASGPLLPWITPTAMSETPVKGLPFIFNQYLCRSAARASAAMGPTSVTSENCKKLNFKQMGSSAAVATASRGQSEIPRQNSVDKLKKCKKKKGKKSQELLSPLSKFTNKEVHC